MLRHFLICTGAIVALTLGLVAQTPAHRRAPPETSIANTHSRRPAANAIPRFCSAHMGRQSFTADHPDAARRRRG